MTLSGKQYFELAAATNSKRVAINDLFPCTCCGFLTFDQLDSWNLCPVCFWEDDPVQEAYPNERTGANQVTLVVARENFKKFGACELRHIQHVRAPSLQEYLTQQVGEDNK